LDYNFLIGKKISLVISNVQDENDVKVFLGEVIKTNEELKFVNKSKNWNVSIPISALETVKEVTADMKVMLLDAEYFISLAVGELPNESSDGYTGTGLIWK